MKKKGEAVGQYFAKGINYGTLNFLYTHKTSGKVQALKQDLAYDKRDPKRARKKDTLKRIIANMTIGNDMSGLFSEVVDCIQSPLLEIKKMVYLYLINYAKQKSNLAVLAVNSLQKVTLLMFHSCIHIYLSRMRRTSTPLSVHLPFGP
jgi:hypothetical protein